MRKVLVYIVVMAWLFAGLDFTTVYLTRIADRNWLDWMHTHETAYARIVSPVELVLSAPSVALKPIFYEAFKKSTLAQEEQDAITHAPNLNTDGFYQLPDRRYSWTFVPWWDWFLYWTPISILWYCGVEKWKQITKKFTNSSPGRLLCATT